MGGNPGKIVLFPRSKSVPDMSIDRVREKPNGFTREHLFFLSTAEAAFQESFD
jgi:hypothetical protein